MRQGSHRWRRIALALAVVGVAATAPAPASADEKVRLTLDDTSPAKVFWSGARRAAFRFEIGGSTARDVHVQAVNKRTRSVVRSWGVEDVEPGTRRTVRWSGSLSGGGRVANGEYYFKVRGERGLAADRKRSKGTRSFYVFDHKFPIRGRHTYGDGVGAGRGHRGQDVFARCGKRLRAARAGRVQFKGNQPSGAGRYLVIDGKATPLDYVYMHLGRGVRVREGEKVRTGEMIGRVGRTGNASGCHLHFELWSGPGWFEGGTYLRSVRSELRRWDRWS